VTDYLEKRVLVVVKTYPNPSATYGETVCCAGVDLDTRDWMRLYPITFRQLADRRFGKFQEIRCRVARPRTDARPESWRVDQDSIQLVGDPMPAGARGWTRRMAALPAVQPSLEAIVAAQRSSGTSLGMVRPKEITKLWKRPAKPWTPEKRAVLGKLHLNLGAEMSRQLSELEQIPWTFGYEFVCDDRGCKGRHNTSIIDWEIGAAYRNWRREYGDDWEEALRQKFERELPASDLHLVMGNSAEHPRSFMVVGLVRPPRPKVDGGYVQQTLDLMGQKRAVTGLGIGLEAEQTDALGPQERHEAIELFPDES
jgi:hypothetical protein